MLHGKCNIFQTLSPERDGKQVPLCRDGEAHGQCRSAVQLVRELLQQPLPQRRFDRLPLDCRLMRLITLEALAYDTNKSIIPEYKEVLLKTKYARDNESEDMIDIMANSVSFEFGLNAWQDTVANPLVKNIFVARNPSVASTLAKMQTSVDTQIEKLVEKLEQ